MSDVVTARVTQTLEQLRLHTAAGTLETHLRMAHERELSPLQFVDHLLAGELAARQERSITVRTKLAHFPVLKSLDSFNFDAQPSLDRKIVNEEHWLRYGVSGRRKRNVKRLGNLHALRQQRRDYRGATG